MQQHKFTAHLNQVIECLQQQSRSPILSHKSSQNINSLYESTKNLLGQFQDHFSRCKKYNQAKIHRKYQIIITDLAEQNRDLHAKIKLQTSARPSSQKYVSDLVDKMIELRNNNQKLMKENANLKNYIVKVQQKYEPMTKNNKSNDEDNPENKELMKKEWEKMMIKDTVSQFNRIKKEESSTQHFREISNFQKFLQFNQSKIDRWELIDLFQRIDKWTSNLKDLRIMDKTKIKLNFQRELSKLYNHASLDRNSQTVNSTVQKTTSNNIALQNLRSKHILMRGDHNKTKRDKHQNFRLRSLYRSDRKIQAVDVNLE